MPCCKKQRCDPLMNNSSTNGMKLILMKDTTIVNDDEEDEEDSSITSTVPVTVTKAGQCCCCSGDDISLSSCESSSSSSNNSNKTPTTTRRTVHFDESQNKIHIDLRHHNKSDDEYNKDDLWYNSLDYQQFRMTTTHIANKIAQAGATADPYSNDSFARTYYKVLQRTYEACCQASEESDNDMNDDTKSINNNIFANATERAYIQQWIHAANASSGALLGIAEKHAIHDIVLDKSHRRLQLVSAILEIQDFCTRHHHATDVHGRAAVAEMMRCASCEASRPSRLFAQVLANFVL